MQKTFPTAYVFPTESRPSNVQNIMIVSSNQPLWIWQIDSFGYCKECPTDYLVDELNKQEHFYNEIIDTSNVPFLTDQSNPSEVLINPITRNPYV